MRIFKYHTFIITSNEEYNLITPLTRIDFIYLDRDNVIKYFIKIQQLILQL
jgi:hypothetical protein